MGEVLASAEMSVYDEEYQKAKSDIAAAGKIASRYITDITDETGIIVRGETETGERTDGYVRITDKVEVGGEGGKRTVVDADGLVLLDTYDGEVAAFRESEMKMNSGGLVATSERRDTGGMRTRIGTPVSSNNWSLFEVSSDNSNSEAERSTYLYSGTQYSGGRMSPDRPLFASVTTQAQYSLSSGEVITEVAVDHVADEESAYFRLLAHGYQIDNGEEIYALIEASGYGGHTDNPSYLRLVATNIDLNAPTTVCHGDLKVNGHSTPIGTTINGSYVRSSSLASGTEMVPLTNVISLDAGTYLITASVRYGDMAGHRCAAQIYSSISGGEYVGNGASRGYGAADGAYALHITGVESHNEPFNVRIYGFQVSGKTQSNVTTYYSITRIA